MARARQSIVKAGLRAESCVEVPAERAVFQCLPADIPSIFGPVSLVTLADVIVQFGASTILRDLSVTVSRSALWGVVGRNGAGKTTIFRLITGQLHPTSGTVTRQSGLRVELLDQHREFAGAETVWDAAAAGYQDLLAQKEELDALGAELESLGSDVTDADVARYGRVQERLAHMGGYDFQVRIDAVLQGLGFDPERARTQPLGTLSGGERGRVGLAAQLAAPADLRLFDEPTNHLDLDTTRWLAGYLKDVGETVMIISHDRAFLDDTVDHLLHVHGGTAASYRGGYSDFVTQRGERELTQQRAVAKQQAFIKKEEDYISRNIAGQNTAQAKGRRTRLARLPRLSRAPGENDTMTLRLEAGERGGNLVVDVKDLRVAVGERTLVDDVTVSAMRRDVIALVGANGAGKTTFLATLLGARQPDAGEVRLGASIAPAWYRQDLAGVPLNRTMFDTIHDLRPQWNIGQVHGHLGLFGFSGDEVHRKTDSLSGGERARVALAMITLARANLLVLDEPTNHLDVEGIEALEDAIEQYAGTVILVSHDRAFLRELATRVWAIEGEALEDFPGPFVDWEIDRAERARKWAEQAATAAAGDRTSAKRDRVRRPNTDRALRAAHRAAKAAESKVEEIEARVTQLEAELANGSLYDGTEEGTRRAGELARRLDEGRAQLDEMMAEWACATDALEALQE